MPAANTWAGVGQPSVLRGRLIEPLLDAAQLLGVVHGQVGPLREVLAQQAVGVLVGRPFPEPAGVREEDTVAEEVGVDGQDLVLCRLVVGDLRTESLHDVCLLPG
jgi:hypothetical protein